MDSMVDAEERLLSISTCALENELAQITVQDTGSGISQPIAEKLFQPFVTSKPNGMGVGLSICRTIVEAHGGQIWFEAAPEGGTIFRFTLPRVEDDNDRG
jgi:two-component system sensor kinase FixL